MVLPNYLHLKGILKLPHIEQVQNKTHSPPLNVGLSPKTCNHLIAQIRILGVNLDIYSSHPQSYPSSFNLHISQIHLLFPAASLV